jgi:hypothetical protein
MGFYNKKRDSVGFEAGFMYYVNTNNKSHFVLFNKRNIITSQVGPASRQRPQVDIRPTTLKGSGNTELVP